MNSTAPKADTPKAAAPSAATALSPAVALGTAVARYDAVLYSGHFLSLLSSTATLVRCSHCCHHLSSPIFVFSCPPLSPPRTSSSLRYCCCLSSPLPLVTAAAACLRQPAWPLPSPLVHRFQLLSSPATVSSHLKLPLSPTLDVLDHLSSLLH